MEKWLVKYINCCFCVEYFGIMLKSKKVDWISEEVKMIILY